MATKLSSLEITKQNNRILFDVQKGKEKVKLSLAKKDAETVAEEILRLVNEN